MAGSLPQRAINEGSSGPRGSPEYTFVLPRLIGSRAKQIDDNRKCTFER